MRRFADGWLALVCLISLATVANAQEPDSSLRTFVLDKPPAPSSLTSSPTPSTDLNLPKSMAFLRTTVGVGYVQGADWGTEIRSLGTAAGLQVQLDSLWTRGRHGTQFDHGALSVSDPDAGWRVDAGDVFSNVRGASRGARLTWQARGNRQPSLAYYGPVPGLPARPTVLAYRDQWRFKSQTLLDMELASDRSHFLRTHLAAGRADLEASYRRTMTPQSTREGGVQMSVAIGRGLYVSGGALRSIQNGETSDWGTVTLRVPLTKYMDVTIERAFARASQTTNHMSAAMFGVLAGDVRMFHRFQWGRTDLSATGLPSIAREHLQSMAAYTPGPRLSLSLQLATDWSESGRTQQWEELQTTLRVTRSTTLQTVTAVPDLLNSQRLRLRFTQDLPRHFALVAEYGRLAAFQDIPFELDRPRTKIMIQKIVNVATPGRGGDVRGRVTDQNGHPVSGARVVLGAYHQLTGADGGYIFSHLPHGGYELSLDEAYLPADYAWDGRRLQLTVGASTHERIDVLVAPLNAIHGRVYCDRNNNGRVDAGEAVAGAVIHLNDRVTATDESGAYSFYNLWPATYALHLDAARLPAGFDAAGPTDLSVVLTDDRPVTGADFRVSQKIKPIIWREPIK